MKMENARMEFVTFDTADVIATSGGGNPVEDTLTMIWIPAASVTNFNNFSNDDVDLKIGDAGWAYYSYSGTLTKDKCYWYNAHLTEEKPAENMIFYVNSADDAAGYYRILQWLTAHQQ